ncbi:MAG TPA: ribokinase [Candidatus Limnocylindrales bacterium]
MSGRVIVVGSVNVDLVARVGRLPRAGETVTGDSFERHHGGKGGNQAVAAARLGRPTLFIGAVGDDAFAAEARRALAAERVDVSMLASLPGQPTGVALILVDETGENEIAVIPGANCAIEPGTVRAAMARLGRLAGDVVLLCNEIPVPIIREALLAAREAGARTILNPAPAVGLDRSVLGLADIITPNRSELATLAESEARRVPKRRDETADIPGRARHLMQPDAEGRAVREAVIVTLGSAGVFVIERERPAPEAAPEPEPGPPGEASDEAGEAEGGAPVPPRPPVARSLPPFEGPLLDRYRTWELPSDKVATVDSTGAGDAFNGALAAALAAGRTLEEAVRRAVAAGALATTRAGAREGMPGLDELQAFISSR